MKNNTDHKRDSAAPRWALFRVTRIPNLVTGAIYLWRLRIIETPWFGVFLHKINEPDNDRNVHDHPWKKFRSLILKGGYTEWRVHVEGEGLARTESHTRRWYSWFSVNKINEGDFHTIEHLWRGRPCWTLVLVGRRSAEWGFLVGDEKVLKNEYIPQRINELRGA
jgi:hypothetical protein